MKIKFVSSHYDKETGVSTVIVKCKDRFYTGNAVVSPEDMEKGYASRYLGCNIAEIRAHKECVKSEICNLRLQLKGAQRLAAAILSGNKEILSPVTYKYLNKRINAFMDSITDTIYDLKEKIRSYDDAVHFAVEKYEKKKKKDEGGTLND